MEAYLPKSFRREAYKAGVNEDHCRAAIRKAESGLIDADLGGGLIKQRIGASKGSRAVIFYRRGKVAVFLHVFPKNRKANLTKSELEVYLKLARAIDALTEGRVKEMVATNAWSKLEL